MPSSPSTTARARARAAPARRSTGGWPTASSATWPCSSTRARPTFTTIRSTRFQGSPPDVRARPRRRAAPRPRRGRPGRHAPLVRRHPRRRGPARALSARVGRRARGATRRGAGALPAGPAGREGTAPPEAVARWRRLFDGAAAPAPPRLPAADPALVERSAALAELPEMAGWFLDPEAVQVDAVELLAARESRLVVSDQVKAEREDAIVGRVIARELGPEARRRWARRLAEMSLVFDATGRADLGALARAAAAALADPDADAGRHPFARAPGGTAPAARHAPPAPAIVKRDLDEAAGARRVSGRPPIAPAPRPPLK